MGVFNVQMCKRKGRTIEQMPLQTIFFVCSGCVAVHLTLRHLIKLTSDDNVIYFALHVLLNVFVCQSVYLHVLDSFDANRFIAATSELTSAHYECVFVICGFHLYHIVVQ